MDDAKKKEYALKLRQSISEKNKMINQLQAELDEYMDIAESNRQEAHKAMEENRNLK